MPVSQTLYKWQHTIHIVLWLAVFTSHFIWEMHLCWGVAKMGSFLLLYNTLLFEKGRPQWISMLKALAWFGFCRVALFLLQARCSRSKARWSPRGQPSLQTQRPRVQALCSRSCLTTSRMLSAISLFMGANLGRVRCYFIGVYFVSFASLCSLINEAVHLVFLCGPLRTPLL